MTRTDTRDGASLPVKPETVTPDDILDVKAVCRIFRIGRDEVYRLVHSGKLPVMRFGKHGKTWRFYKPDVLRLRHFDGQNNMR